MQSELHGRIQKGPHKLCSTFKDMYINCIKSRVYNDLQIQRL